MTIATDAVIDVQDVSKAFSGVQALSGVSLQLHKGRLTALLGENGAGKSTLMNIVAGVLKPDSGTLHLQGQPVHFENPRQAQDRGIAMIFQELNLLPNLTIAENIFIGREPVNKLGLIDYRTMNRNASRIMEELELPLAPATPVNALRVGQQQVVEIAKAISRDPHVIIMDEPTSALTDHEVEVLLRLIQRLKARGVAIAYITHKLEELPRIADDAVIMRDGRVVHTGPLAELSREQIVRLMVGRPEAEFYTKAESPGERAEQAARGPLFEVRHISLRDADRPERLLVNDVSLAVRPGEVLGIFGLMGAGRTEFLETIFGAHPKHFTGEVLIDGTPVAIRSPAQAIAAGLALVPEDRKRDGLVMSMSVGENASLASLRAACLGPMISRRRERGLISGYIDRLRVKTPSLSQRVRFLSGGNQQKVILAKWLAAKPRVILLDEPTRGIDVNAKREIYLIIEQLAREGLAILMVSSELPEILAIADRVVVICLGKKTAEFSRSEANEQNVLSAALPATLRSNN